MAGAVALRTAVHVDDVGVPVWTVAVPNTW
jgi:hypothetical protein